MKRPHFAGSHDAADHIAPVVAEQRRQHVSVCGIHVDRIRSLHDALVRQKIEEMLDEGMVLISNAGLRRRVLDVFDQTFAITYALEAIAVLVALLGVATGLSSNILERRREIGTLRALGLTKRGVEAAIGVVIAGNSI